MPWEKVIRLVGEEENRLLCDDRILLPETLKRFVPQRYGSILAQKFLLEVLRTAQIPPGRIKLALYDPCAQYTPIAEQLMAYSSQLYVVTENLVAYRAVEEKLMDQYGGVVLFADCLNSLDCSVILSPGRLLCPLYGKSGSFLFTGIAPAQSVDCMVFDQYHVTLPPAERARCPAGLNSDYFAAALYEFCNRHDFRRLTPDSCCCGNEIYSVQRMAEILTNALA